MRTKTRSLITGIALLMMGLSLISAVTLTVPGTVRADPAVLYAAPAVSGSGDCSSWANACTLQTALTGASSGDEIWVITGVHYPGSNRDDHFSLQSGVAVYGGFTGVETSLDQRNWQANPTILSGDIDGNDTNTDGNFIAETWNDIQGNNAYHVLWVAANNGDITETTVIDGFTITAGKADGSWPHMLGGGMYNRGYSGVGRESSPTLTNVTFSGNSAWYGGGIFNDGEDGISSPALTNVTFSGNGTNDAGGGMYNHGLDGVSSPTLTNVIFSGNTAGTDVGTGHGGGMFSYGGGGVSSPALTNVTFSDNQATWGGGMYNVAGSGEVSPVLTNVTFSGNHAAESGSGMFNSGYGGEVSPVLTNVILTSPTRGIINVSSMPRISYSDVQGCGGSGAGWNSACGIDNGGNIDADPLFVDAANGNLRLLLTSPAIDAGNNAALPPGILTDLDGNPRFVDIPTVPNTGSGAPPIVDMGAYENQTFLCPVGGVLFVDQDAAGLQTGDSWADALTTLQDALQVIEACELWVAEGVYYPDQGGGQIDNDRTATFALKSSVPVYGGFAGTETSRDQRDWQANLTVLSGDIDQNDLTDPKGVVTNTAHITGTNAYHVVVTSGVADTTVLDGFVITAGQANGIPPDDYGGGMLNSGNPTLTNVTFSGNSADEAGGGMHNSYGSPILTHVTFSSNAAFHSGGMSNIYGSPMLTNVTFSGNSADEDCGGMRNFYTTPTLMNVTFNGNTAVHGGGMCNHFGDSTLTNVTFSDNTAVHGGGMFNSECDPALTNVILWGNSAPNGAGIHNESSTPQISYSDIQGCGGSGSWNSACGADGGGNIEADPLFVDPVHASLAPTTAGNYRLGLGSPAIDVGDDAVVTALVDLDGKLRQVDGNCDGDAVVDLGAYEYAYHDFNTSGLVDVQDIMQAAARWNNPAAYDPTYDVAPPFGSPIDILDIIAIAEQWDSACQ